MLNEIIKYYKKMPNHGLYLESEENRITHLKKYIDFFKIKTKDLPDVVYLKKKIKLERNGINQKNLAEYKIINDKIKQLGLAYAKIGSEFEKKTYSQLKKNIVKIFGINTSDFIIHKNKTLFKKHNKEWGVIGEIDAVIIYKKNNINYIICICEIKNNFDDLPDAYYQINRSYDILKDKGNNDVRLNDIILDDSYKMFYNNVNETSLIVSKFDPDNTIYLNIQSKLKFPMLMMINIYNSKATKILKKINKKQNKGRYTKDVLITINTFINSDLKNRILIL